MSRVVIAALVLAAISPIARAGESVVRVEVGPMAAPEPALRYQLLPEPRELNPGNAAQNYLKCFMEQKVFFFTKEAAAQRLRYQSMPLEELRAAELRNYGGSALRQADWAARLDVVDWQPFERRGSGGIEVLPGELGPIQLLGAALQVRFRAEVAARSYDDAIRSAKTMFALARHLGEHPTEIASLVGMSVEQLCLSTLLEMVQQPGCPNLYWALADLPCPLVNLRTGARGDCTLIAADLRALRDDAPMTDAEIEAVVSRLSGVMTFAREQRGQAPRSPRTGLVTAANDPDRVRAAGRRLVEAGSKHDVVERLPPVQVILLDEKCKYEIQRDEQLKLLALPLWQIDELKGGEATEQRGDGLFADLLPHITQLRRTEGLLEQQIALLRHVEALRLYAARHGGKLPARSCDIPLPLPVDALSGEPIGYSLEGTTSHLHGKWLPGKERNTTCGIQYEVTLRK